MNTETLLTAVTKRFAHQPLFVQAVTEFLASITTVTDDFATTDWQRLERLLVPERIISFRVTWEDDNGVLQHNMGYRVQFNSALGPYKGGLRFDPSVNEDVLKFLGFEQIFKNALTGLPLGGGKGGSDFNPKGKSDAEIRRFCYAFMTGLREHIGIDTDVPAGDIGVGGREIGYLYGAYKLLTNSNEGALTGKDELFGGSCRRTEATGHGVVYFAEAMAKQHNLSLAGMTAVISGSGNVAEYTARALLDRQVVVLTLSDRSGYLYKETGFTHGDITAIAAGKDDGRSLSDIAVTGATFHPGRPWEVAADAYFPCATQNEVGKADAEHMIKTAKLIVEGANMPLSLEAIAVVQDTHIPFAPGKAANAGGVSVSGLEMAQNAGHYAWTCEAVETELKNIMNRIHTQCVKYGATEDGVDYVKGANIAGAKRVLDAMKKLGW
ncbi:NADP-specific glutamate dehydrogenase [Candidatus Kaiserbacteria bacterium]|nr:NADP-specific glutamate dehydrogenase [Candidatus Kaiserbacteria bacterium]